MKNTWQKFIKTYVRHPWKLISENAGVLFIFFIVILVNFLTDKNSFTVASVLSVGWAFEILPQIIRSMVLNPLAISFLMLLYLIKSVLTVIVAKEMMLVFSHKRLSIMDTIRHISIRDVIWFIWAELAIYFLFSLIAVVFYLPSSYIWIKYRTDLSMVLYFLFALFYPAFYISLSITSMISVFPLSNLVRFSKLKYLFNWRAALKLYLFYTLRLGFEGILLLIVPILALLVWDNRLIATLSVAVGLVVPFALLRGSAYELKLHIFSEDADIKSIFTTHYQENQVDR